MIVVDTKPNTTPNNPPLEPLICKAYKPAITLTDKTATCAIARLNCKEKIDMVEKAAKEADLELSNYILLAVTENLSYAYLQSKLEIPCGRDMYYDRYRKFFWLLDKMRQ